jgi:hypothetical protein
MWRTHCIPVTYLKTVRWNWSYINITKVILSTDQLGDRNHIVIRTERLTNYDRLSTNKRRKQWRTGRTATGRTFVSEAKHQKGANTAEHTPNAESQTALWGGGRRQWSTRWRRCLLRAPTVELTGEALQGWLRQEAPR